MRKRSGRNVQSAEVPCASVDDSLNLDLTALGLLTVILRHEDGADVTLAAIGRKYGYGEDAMARAMGMLQVAQYVVKVRVMGARNRWCTEVAVYAPPADADDVAGLLEEIRREDPEVRRVQVIPPTATAGAHAKKRRAKLAGALPATVARVCAGCGETYDSSIPDHPSDYYADPRAYSDPAFVPHWATCKNPPVAKQVPAPTRKEVLDRDGRKCLACGATDDLTLDHVQHRSNGGDHEPENLRTLCRSCNSRRGTGLLAEVDG